MTIRDKMLAYVSTKLNRLELERDAIRRNMQMKPLDGFDMYEMMRSEVRIEAWDEFIHELLALLMS